MERLILEDKKLENKIINAAYKNFKKEQRKSPSVVTEENDVINEGLKYFKASPRLYKLALKIERKSARNPELKLDEVVKKINALANKFEYVEDLYEVGKKAEAKAHYKELCKKYEDVLKILRKDDVKNGLKKIGGLAFTIASMVVPYMTMMKFFPNLFSVSTINTDSNMGFGQKAFAYLKRAGAFTLCGLPVKAARGAFRVGVDAAELKSLARVDKLIDNSEIDYSNYDDEELHQLQ